MIDHALLVQEEVRLLSEGRLKRKPGSVYKAGAMPSDALRRITPEAMQERRRMEAAQFNSLRREAARQDQMDINRNPGSQSEQDKTPRTVGYHRNTRINNKWERLG